MSSVMITVFLVALFLELMPYVLMLTAGEEIKGLALSSYFAQKTRAFTNLCWFSFIILVIILAYRGI
jgi:hypothetical protein